MCKANKPTGQSVKELKPLPPIISEISEPAAAFQRELYRAADNRVLHLDQQAAVLIAAAIALAGYGASALGGGKIASEYFIGLSVAGGVTIVIALCARSNHPWLPTCKNSKMQDAKREARDACRALDDLKKLTTVAEVQVRIYDAWRTLVDSSDRRRAEKQEIHLIAVLTLLLETAFLCLGLIQGTGP